MSDSCRADERSRRVHYDATPRRTPVRHSRRAMWCSEPRHDPSGILPPYAWAKLSRTEFVIIDELHAYRGVFGITHQRAARLRRILRTIR